MNFEETAAKAEVMARDNIGLYKTKLFFYAVLGYVVIFGLLVMLVGTVAGLVFLGLQSGVLLVALLKTKVLFLCIPAIWIMLTALWIKLEPPQGFKVNASDFPELFGAVDAISSKLDAPKIHEILLIQDLNASISQTPRLGIFGWNKNTLTLGVELLLILTPSQASSVVGHELGHLSGNHARFNGWIYRVRLSWGRIMQAFDQRSGVGVGMMRKFFDWYAPKFSAYSFALARANEYEADAMAAALTDRKTTSEALINVHVAGRYVEESYWQNFSRKADDMPEPDHLPWAGLSDWLRTEKVVHEEIAKRLEEELTVETSYGNTHPSLKDRLKALETEPFVPQASEQTAARAWLGEQYDSVVGHFDQEWVVSAADSWRARYDYAQSSKKTLEELEDKKSGDLDDEQLWQKASLVEEFVSPEEALPLYRTYQQRYPDHALAAFSIGRLVFDKNDSELLTQMKVAVKDPQLTISACQIAYAALEKSGRTDEAQWWVDKANDQARIDELARQEREELTVGDELVAYELSQDESDILVKQLSALPKVKHAWVARKVVSHYPELPVMAIAVSVSGIVLDEESFIQKASEQLDFGVHYFLVPAVGNFKPLTKRIEKAGHQLF